MSIYQVNRQASTLPALDQCIADTVFIAFDTETTGLSPVAARLVELSGVKFTGGGKVLSTYQSLIDPKQTIPPESTAVHGITDEMVADAPTLHTVLPEFVEWAATQHLPGSTPAVWIAHNAPFDIAFLEVAMARANVPFPENLIVDTLPLARRLVPDSPNYQLRTLVEHLGLASQTYHRALADSHHVRNLFLHIAGRLGAGAKVETVVELSGRLHFGAQAAAGKRWQDSPELERISRAIEGGQQLRIFYSGTRRAERLVTPLAVLFTGGIPYLSAFCHLADAERTFRIDRIVKIEAGDRQE